MLPGAPARFLERKLDGERCLAFVGSAGTRLMSRSQRQITSTFPEIAGVLDARRRGDLIVDGEIIAFPAIEAGAAETG